MNVLVLAVQVDRFLAVVLDFLADESANAQTLHAVSCESASHVRYAGAAPQSSAEGVSGNTTSVCRERGSEKERRTYRICSKIQERKKLNPSAELTRLDL